MKHDRRGMDLYRSGKRHQGNDASLGQRACSFTRRMRKSRSQSVLGKLGSWGESWVMVDERGLKVEMC